MVVMPNPSGKWTDQEWNSFREFLRMVLAKQTVEVTFTKVNGDIRVMECTLNPEVLPKVVVNEDKPKREKKNPETSLAVYDVKAEGWRSFVIKNVNKVLYTD